MDDVGIDGKGLRPEGLARRRFEAVPSALERTRTFEGRSRDQEIRGSRLKGVIKERKESEESSRRKEAAKWRMGDRERGREKSKAVYASEESRQINPRPSSADRPLLRPSPPSQPARAPNSYQTTCLDDRHSPLPPAPHPSSLRLSGCIQTPSCKQRGSASLTPDPSPLPDLGR